MTASSLSKLFHKRMRREYANLGDFWERTKIPVSMETCRRFLTDGKPISASSLAILAKYLGFQGSEIKAMISDPTNIAGRDKDWRAAADMAELIGEDNIVLADGEKAMLNIYAVLREKSPDLLKTIVGMIATVDKAMKLGLSGDLKRVV